MFDYQMNVINFFWFCGGESKNDKQFTEINKTKWIYLTKREIKIKEYEDSHALSLRKKI